MIEVEVSIDSQQVLELLSERDIIDYYGAICLFDEFKNKEALKAIEECCSLDADSIVDCIKNDITEDKIRELYNSL